MILPASPRSAFGYHLGDVEKNKQEILKQMAVLEAQGVQAAVFPELCITGYTLGDLLLHETVQQSAYKAMLDLSQSRPAAWP